MASTISALLRVERERNENWKMFFAHWYAKACLVRTGKIKSRGENWESSSAENSQTRHPAACIIQGPPSGLKAQVTLSEDVRKAEAGEPVSRRREKVP
jgi:hypothetical protein